MTIGIVTLASVDPSDPEFFWSNVLGITTKANRITLDNVDGGSGPVSDATGSGETTLDVEQSGALAPDANIVVYQAPNTDVGFVDGFYTAASQNIADSVSSSWGESESEIQAAVDSGVESPAYANSFDDAFLELAAQGQSAFVSAGDFGAYTAVEDSGRRTCRPGTRTAARGSPRRGGTTLPGTIPLTATDSATIRTERTWGWDWLWPHFADFTDPATGQPFTSEARSRQHWAWAAPAAGSASSSRRPRTSRACRSAHKFSATEYLTPTDNVPVAPGTHVADRVDVQSPIRRSSPAAAPAGPRRTCRPTLTRSPATRSTSPGDSPATLEARLGRDELRGTAAQRLDSAD